MQTVVTVNKWIDSISRVLRALEKNDTIKEMEGAGWQECDF